MFSRTANNVIELMAELGERGMRDERRRSQAGFVWTTVWAQESSEIMESEALEKYWKIFILLPVDNGRSKQFQSFIY